MKWISTQARSALFGAALLACVLLGTGAVQNPTLGPPTQEVLKPRIVGTPISSLPITIDECGYYFLTDCLDGVSGQNGITIDADDVTLDLNGFTLRGVPGSLHGVEVLSTRVNAAIRNGVIRDWGQDGVNANTNNGCEYRNLRICGNQGRGIWAAIDCVVAECVVRENSGAGIQVEGNSVVTGCVCNGNGGNGISAVNSLIMGNTALFNGGAGIGPAGGAFPATIVHNHE